MSNHRMANHENAVREIGCRSPSILGRLIAIATLRDVRAPEHQELAARYGAERIEPILKQLHEQTFGDWLHFSLEDQTEDLKVYCRSTNAGEEMLIGLPGLVERSIPEGRQNFERRLVLSDLEVVIGIARTEI